MQIASHKLPVDYTTRPSASPLHVQTVNWKGTDNGSSWWFGSANMPLAFVAPSHLQVTIAHIGRVRRYRDHELLKVNSIWCYLHMRNEDGQFQKPTVAKKQKNIVAVCFKISPHHLQYNACWGPQIFDMRDFRNGSLKSLKLLAGRHHNTLLLVIEGHEGCPANAFNSCSSFVASFSGAWGNTKPLYPRFRLLVTAIIFAALLEPARIMSSSRLEAALTRFLECQRMNSTIASCNLCFGWNNLLFILLEALYLVLSPFGAISCQNNAQLMPISDMNWCVPFIFCCFFSIYTFVFPPLFSNLQA